MVCLIGADYENGRLRRLGIHTALICFEMKTTYKFFCAGPFKANKDYVRSKLCFSAEGHH